MEKKSREELDELWRDYKKNPTPQKREDLAKYYSFLVRSISHKFLRKKPNILDSDDLIQAGNMGLLDAIEKFKPEMGNQFQTYATIRIRGSILDEINSMDWTPRRDRERIKNVIKVIESKYSSGEIPDVELIAQDTGYSVHEVRHIIAQMNKTYIIPIEQDFMEAATSRDELAFKKQSQEQELILFLQAHLTPMEQTYIKARFFDKETNKLIAEKLSLSAKEVQDIRDSAFRKLKNKLRDFKHDRR